LVQTNLFDMNVSRKTFASLTLVRYGKLGTRVSFSTKITAWYVLPFCRGQISSQEAHKTLPLRDTVIPELEVSWPSNFKGAVGYGFRRMLGNNAKKLSDATMFLSLATLLAQNLTLDPFKYGR
jgi:hypothetical protein